MPRLNNSRLSMFEQKSPKSNNSPSVARSKRNFNNRRGKDYNASGQFSNLSKKVFGETNESFREKMGANNNSWKTKSGEINWTMRRGEKLDVTQGNKNLICRYMLKGHSDEDDDLCLGNGSALMNPKSQTIAEDLENAFLDNSSDQTALDNAFRKYLNVYDDLGLFKSAGEVQGTDMDLMLKLINIRTCGLERYLVYLNELVVGIYVPTKEEEAKSLEKKIHFPLYLHEEMKKKKSIKQKFFKEAQQQFHQEIDRVRGHIIKVSSDGATESQRSKVEGAAFGKGSFINKYVLEKGVNVLEKGVKGVNRQRLFGNSRSNNGKKGVLGGINNLEKARSGLKSTRRNLTGGGIMLGQLMASVKDDGSFSFEIIGTVNITGETATIVKATDNELCSQNSCSDLDALYNKPLKNQTENGNKVFKSSDDSVRLYPKEIYGDSQGEKNYDIKIPAANRSNIIKFCGGDGEDTALGKLQKEMNALANHSSKVGNQMSNNITKREALIKQLSEEHNLSGTQNIRDKYQELTNKDKDSLAENEPQLLELLKELENTRFVMGGGSRSRKNKRGGSRVGSSRKGRKGRGKRCGSKKLGGCGAQRKRRSRRGKK